MDLKNRDIRRIILQTSKNELFKWEFDGEFCSYTDIQKDLYIVIGSTTPTILYTGWLHHSNLKDYFWFHYIPRISRMGLATNRIKKYAKEHVDDSKIQLEREEKIKKLNLV